jgi:Fic family protein
MNESAQNRFSEDAVETFRERRLPESAALAGYSALIDVFELAVPLPLRLSAIGSRHRVVETNEWRLLTPRHAPDPSLEGHLTFALKHEGLDLCALKGLFEVVAPSQLESIVRATPTGGYARRIWFLYEWLTGRRLNLPDADQGRYVPAVDPTMQFGGDGVNSRRHLVRDNLPGTPDFCPLVFRSDTLVEFASRDLPERARAVVADVPRDLLARTAAFLLLKDSRSSYAIEGERPPQDRIQRWGRVIGQAGERPLDRTELLRLQKVVIGDERFVQLGLRTDDGFVGEHDRTNRMPIPDHVSARPQDLDSLIDGLLDFASESADQLDPVVSAAILAFGFVFIHPFDDGNGRVHRYLIHHILSRRGFHPPGMVFPVSSAILGRVEAYRDVLEGYSNRVLPLIEWEPTDSGNVRVTSETADYYRYFDATPHAEFLYACVQQTVDEDLPQETDYLRRYDTFSNRVQQIVDMPDSTIDLLFRFLDQSDGRLSKRALEGEFSPLAQHEVEQIEAIYAQIFGGE